MIVWEVWTDDRGSFRKFNEEEAEELGVWFGEQLKRMLTPRREIHVVSHDSAEYGEKLT